MQDQKEAEALRGFSTHQMLLRSLPSQPHLLLYKP